MLGAVVIEVSSRPEAEVHSLLRQLHWGIAWLHDLLRRRELSSIEGKVERIGSVMEVVATALGRDELQQTLFDIANHVARYLRCSRVAVGLRRERRVRVAALSNAAWFEKNSSTVKLYAAAMEEAYDRLAPIAYTAANDPATPAPDAASAHARLARECGAQALLSVPLQRGAECIGVLTLERQEGGSFDEMERAWVDALVALLPALIEQKRRAERGYLARAREDARTLATRLFGPKHLTWKFSATLITVLVAVLTLTETEYRVSAKTVIEGELQRAAVAPFASFVAATYVRAGDIVREGQILCALDDNDLRLEQHRWKSELEQNSGKLREAIAKHDLAAFQVLSAQVRQSEAQLALAEDRLQRAKITAPFDGVVISGDLSQLVGSPVEQGKKLFEIAPLASYRVILQVDEREIRHIEIGQTGKLVITGITGDPFTFGVSKVTPVATAQDGRNFFRVEAELENAVQHLRPGMEGIGKISIGERRLWWVLTHGFTDWLRLWLWSWMP
jgi:biotin carboxyl carrier protein